VHRVLEHCADKEIPNLFQIYGEIYMYNCYWYCTVQLLCYRESGSGMDHSLAPVLVAAVRYSVVKVVKCMGKV
jgi:hypothetical protein